MNECQTHSGHVARIEALEARSKVHDIAIERIRNRPGWTATTIISLLTFALGVCATLLVQRQEARGQRSEIRGQKTETSAVKGNGEAPQITQINTDQRNGADKNDPAVRAGRSEASDGKEPSPRPSFTVAVDPRSSVLSGAAPPLPFAAHSVVSPGVASKEARLCP